MNKKETQKIIVLSQLKQQWKIAVQNQYKTEPDKVKNSNIDKNANDIMSNPLVKMNAKIIGIQKEDIVIILTEIRDEVIAGN